MNANGLYPVRPVLPTREPVAAAGALAEEPFIQEAAEAVGAKERRLDMQKGGRGSCRAVPLKLGRSLALPLDRCLPRG